MNIVQVFMIGMAILCVGAVFYLMITNWKDDQSGTGGKT